MEEGENLNTGAPRTGRTPTGGTSAPVGQAQGGPSLAFVKENIDVLRTMIKELDNQGQGKVTPRNLFNEESGGAGSENSEMSPSAEEVGGYSFDGSSRSRSRGRPRSTRKHRKSVSRKKGISKSHRSVRLETRSRSKSKSVKSKPQSVRASRRKSSSDSGYDTVSDSGLEDLSIPYRRPKPMLFTSRITRFRYHRQAKLPPNVRVYEGNKDPEDRLSIFSAAAEQEEWPMPVWCKMIHQTLSGSARNWFDRIDPKSIDGFEELSNKFLEEFSQQKRYDKDPTKIHGIKRKPNEGLQTFMDRFKAESAHIKGVPSVLRIFAFMHGHGLSSGERRLQTQPKSSDLLGGKSVLKRRLHTFDENSKEILAMDNVNFPPPPPMVGTPEKRNMNKFCDYHQDRGKVAKRERAQPKERRLSTWIRRIHVDVGSSSEVMYEHFFINLSYRTRSRLKESRIPLVGFSGEDRDEELRAIAFTIHLMIKFPTSNGIITIATTRETLRECRQIEEAKALSRHARITDPSPIQTSSEVTNPRVLLAPVETRPWSPEKEPMQLDDMEERRQLDKGKKLPKSSVDEKIVVNDNYPEQLVTIGGGLSAECRHALIHTLRKNVDIFAWTPADMMGIPRAITEHSLDTYPHIEPKVQKKRSLAPDKRKVVTDEVNEWLKAGIIRRMRYPSWVSNPVLVKKVDGSWRMCIDFKDLNKACPKDLYPLPEIDWKIKWLTGF
ncbi:reverse transcriptase domain-containing protein [Tanacetum coccineum]